MWTKSKNESFNIFTLFYSPKRRLPYTLSFKVCRTQSHRGWRLTRSRCEAKLHKIKPSAKKRTQKKPCYRRGLVYSFDYIYIQADARRTLVSSLHVKRSITFLTIKVLPVYRDLVHTHTKQNGCFKHIVPYRSQCVYETRMPTRRCRRALVAWFYASNNSECERKADFTTLI